MNNIIYPDGSKEPLTEELLENGSELQRKNVPLAYLRLIARPKREYSGRIGVTTALNGLRMVFFKYMVQPDFNLDDSAFMALGIGAHNLLDDNSANKDDSEEWLEDGMYIGRTDVLEKEVRELGVRGILNDYKVSGSFKVAQAMGIVEGKPVVKRDNFGNIEYYQRNGKGYQKGDPKMEKTYVFDPEKAECWEYEMQLNKYRRMLENNGIQVHEMNLFFIVRDGGTHIANGRGVTRKTYYRPVEKISDAVVDEFFDTKAMEIDSMMKACAGISGTPEEIVAAVKEKGIDVPICDQRENWEGRRCTGYCSYAQYCKLFGDNPYLPDEEKDGSGTEFGK